MQRIYVNGRFLTQSVTGVQRYALELMSAFDSLLDSGEIDINKYKIIIVAPSGTMQNVEYKNIDIVQTGNRTGHLWEQTELLSSTTGGILFSPCNVGPIRHKRHIVTLHDASFLAMPETFSFAFRIWYKFLLNSLCKRARDIVTVSQFSKSEIIKHFKAGSQKITVIYHGREHCLKNAECDILERNKLKSGSYLLAVGSLNQRKNFRIIPEALKQIADDNITIAIAGETNEKVFGKSQYDFDKNTILLGRVSDVELSLLYKNAAAFVYPSLYEGFGLPPLEAMAHNCPVIVSDIPPHREVCDNAGLYFDPQSPDQLAACIKKVMNDANYRNEMTRKSSLRSGEFSWEKCARETWGILSETAL